MIYTYSMSVRLKLCILIAFLITAFFGTAYALSQQVLRQSANDPQIQVAEDIVKQIEAEKQVRTTLSAPAIDMAKTLVTFYIIYDSKGVSIVSTAQLGGKTPAPPSGVFSYTQAHGQDRFTWMPKPGVRIATILLPYHLEKSSGFVLVGRSLREVEKREDQLMKLAAAAWAITIAASCGGVYFFGEQKRKPHKS